MSFVKFIMIDSNGHHSDWWINPSQVVSVRPRAKDNAMILTAAGVEFRVAHYADRVVSCLEMGKSEV